MGGRGGSRKEVWWVVGRAEAAAVCVCVIGGSRRERGSKRKWEAASPIQTGRRKGQTAWSSLWQTEVERKWEWTTDVGEQEEHNEGAPPWQRCLFTICLRRVKQGKIRTAEKVEEKQWLYELIARNSGSAGKRFIREWTEHTARRRKDDRPASYIFNVAWFSHEPGFSSLTMDYQLYTF